MTADEIEQAVFELEEVRIVIRAPKNESLGDFTYERKASATTTVNEWLETRIKPMLNGYQVSVIGGDGLSPHGRKKMETLRNSYAG